MKRQSWILLVVMVLVLAIAFTGCSKKETPAATTTAQAAPAAVQAAPATQTAPAAAPTPVKPALDKDAVLLSAAKTYFTQLSQGNNMISAKDLKAALDDNPDVLFIIDIRSAKDFETSHISGAYHSEWAKLGEVMEKIPQNRQVIVACYSGQKAGQAVATLRLAGFTNVKSLMSGINNGWKAAEFALEGTGMNALADQPSVSSAKNEEQEILWAAAKENFVKVGTEGNRFIQGQELYDQLEANPKAFKVFDIRSKEDFEKGHIAGAVHSVWAQFGNVLDTLDKSDRIVVACYSGQTSGQTVGILRALGFSNAYTLASGIPNGWVAKNLPLVQ
ncbi:MAG: rhodanese-like domain-containing protein [Spirochaetales bacterium]|nr:rhodanese-like domain-containing protein [Spirochaetales bacterium]